MVFRRQGRSVRSHLEFKFTSETLEGRRLLAYSPVGPEISVSASSSSSPAIATDAAGNFVVTWAAENGANGLDIFAQRYLAGGTSVGTPFVVNTTTANDQIDPTIAMNPTGDFVIGWSTLSSSTNGTYLSYCQSFLPNGIPSGGQVQVTPSATPGSPVDPNLAIAVGANGGFQVAFVLVSGGYTSTLYLQEFSSTGVANGSAIQVQQYNGNQIGAAAIDIAATATDSNGDLAIAGYEFSGSVAQDFLAEYSANGTSLISPSLPPSFHLPQSMAIDSEGDLSEIWLTADGNNFDVNAQLYRNFAAAVGTSFVVQANVPAIGISTVTASGSPATDEVVPSAIATDSSGDVQVSVAIPTTVFNGTNYVSEVYLLTKTYAVAGALTGQFQSSAGVTSVRNFPSLCDDSAGDFLLIDTASSTTFGGPIQAQVFQAFSSTAAITGSIWNDSNSNGIYDSTETSATAQSVNLYNSYGVLISSIANASGTYSFSQIMPGQSVYVQVIPVSTVASIDAAYIVTSAGLITLPNAGSNPATNNVFNSVTGIGPVVSLAAGQTLTNQNVGIVTSATITGSVFNDLLGTGIKDSADQLLNGQQIYIDSNLNGVYDAGEPTAISSYTGSGQGQFILYLVRPGTYPVAVNPEPGWSTPPAQVVTVAPGQTQSITFALHESSAGTPPSATGSVTTLATGITHPSVATNDSGASVEGYLGVYPSTKVYFQLYSASGAAVGAAVALNSTGSTTNYAPLVGMASDGGFVVVCDGSSGIFAQCFSSTGVATTSLFNVDNGILGGDVAVAMNASGEFAVSWVTANSSTMIEQIYVRLYSETGTALTAPSPVSSISYANSSSGSSAVAIASDGSGVVVLNVSSSTLTTSPVYLQRFDSSANAVGSDVLVNPGSNVVDAYVGTAMNAAGEFAVAWQGASSNASAEGTFLQRYNPNGSVLGNPTLVSSQYETWAQFGMDSRGDVIGLTANGGTNVASFFPGFYVDRNGALSQFKVSTATVNGYQYSSMAINSAGDGVLVYGVGGSSASYEQRIVSLPAVVDSSFGTASPTNQITLRLSEDVTGFPTASQITVQNLTMGSTVPSGYLSVSTSSDGTISITFPGFSNGTLPSGSYYVDIPASDFTTALARSPSADFQYRFLWIAPVVTGDAVIVRRSTDDTTLQLFENIPEGASPSYSAVISGLNEFEIFGGPGNDSLTIDKTNGLSYPSSGLIFNGQGGANSIQIIGNTRATVVVTPTSVAIGTATTSYLNVQSINMYTGAANDSLTINSGAVVNINAPAPGSGIVAQTLYMLTVNAGGTLRLLSNFNPDGSIDHADRMVLSTSNASLSGTLDAGDNDLILPNTIVSIYQGYYIYASPSYLVAAGLSTGVGIISSAAMFDPSKLTTLATIPATGAAFDGQSTTTSDSIVKFTYYGDANLDGIVDGSDYTKIDNGFANHLTGWNNGDFNYDGVVNGSDYTLIDNAFDTQDASLESIIAQATKMPFPMSRTDAAPSVAIANSAWLTNAAELRDRKRDTETYGAASFLLSQQELF